MTIPPRTARLRLLGVVFLVAGFGAGGFLYWRSLQVDPESTDEAVLREQYASKAYDQAIQRNVGAGGLLMSRLGDQLSEPGAVAAEVALAGALAAGVCFVLAARPPLD